MYNRDDLFILIFGLHVIATANGLQCWNCNNARSVTDCLNTGRIETCDPGQNMVCSSEIRKNFGLGRDGLVSKGCKQGMACRTNVRQNPSQCKPRARNSVCRCCCKNDRCNLIEFWCDGDAPLCDILPVPLNGAKSCDYATNEGELGSKCTFSCAPGFILIGETESTCTQNSRRARAKFDKDPPLCEEDLPPPPPLETEPIVINGTLSKPVTQATPVTLATPVTPADLPLDETDILPPELPISECELAPAAPPNGGRSCLRSRDAVICSYFCGENESMIGSAVAACRTSTGWDGSAPTCVSACRELPENPVDGAVDCQGLGEVGTICRFTCDPGSVLTGPSSIECATVDDMAAWDSEPPICSEIPR